MQTKRGLMQITKKYQISFYFKTLHCHFTRPPSPNAQSYGYINNIDNMPHCPDYNHCRSGIGGQAFFRPRRISAKG